ncbi:hypothetical protein [Paenibacillus sp. FSL K6-2524]|uniref:hypothetical protein n=1 Tax=Paenibacillus sp. FSL K6-2524 TaxID=2954516 RepID=UPI0030F9CDB9
MINHGNKNSGLNMIHKGFLGTIIFLLILLTGNVSQVYATSDWDTALEDINALHDNYIDLQEVIQADNLKIKKLRKQNNDDLKSIKAKLNAIDQILLNRLKTEAELIQQKHSSLLKQYSTLSKQSAAAKKTNDTKAVTIFDLKRNKLKPAATTARAEVKAKTDALTAARKQTATKTKPTKDILVLVTTLKQQVVAENKILANAQQARSEADKRYKVAIKQGDAISAATEMKLSYQQMDIIQSMQKKLYDLEQRIATTLRSAESKLPQ